MRREVQSGSALLLGFLVALVTTVTSAAGAVRFEFAPFGQCVDASSLPVNFDAIGQLLSSTGELKAVAFRRPDAQGRGRFCFQTALIPGDRLHVTVNAQTRELIIPVFSMAVDRVSDIVSGKAPSSTVVKIEISNVYTSTQVSRNITANVSGLYTTDFTLDYNIKGGDRIRASWKNADGDLMVVNLSAPFMTVWFGSPSTFLSLNPFSSGFLELKSSPGGATIAVASGVSNVQGSLAERIWRNGVRTAAGQQVSANFASDALMRIPFLSLQANATTDAVTGRCMSQVLFRIEVKGPSASTSRIGTTGIDGSFAEDFTAAPLDIKPLDAVTVFCRFASGDEIARLTSATP